MSDQNAVPIRPASTILLLRDDPGFEVLMVERHHQIDFASGALVFPGGKVDPSDERHDPDLIDGLEGLPDWEIPFRVAALREAFEEAAVLLARKGGELAGPELIEALEDERKAVDAGELSMTEFAKQTGLTLALDLLVPYARWITPGFMPKRFDTLFYLARMPDRQKPVHDGREMVDCCWIAPDEALKAQQRGERTIIFPTRMNVERLAAFTSTEQALHEVPAQKMVTVEPWIEDLDGKKVLKIQPDAGYGDPVEPLDSIM